MADDYVDPIFDDQGDSGRSGGRTGAETPTPIDNDMPVARRPTDATEPIAPSISAQQPTEEIEPRVAPRSTTQRQELPDDIWCPTCAQRNAKARTFCERCGTALAEVALTGAAEQPDPTWWQRFTGWIRRLGRRSAGDRARATSRSARVAYRRGLSLKNQVARVLGLVGLVGGGLFVADVGPFGDLRASVLDRVTQETVELRPESVTVLPAASEMTQWPANEVSDGRDNTAWGVEWGVAPVPTPCGVDSAASGRLRLTFTRANLERIDVMLGLPDTNFENTARPSQLGIVLSTSTACRVVDLDDTHDEQSIPIDQDGVESVEIWVLSVVDDGADNPGLALISELELFAVE